FLWLNIDTDDLESSLGQTPRCHRADITQAKHADLHEAPKAKTSRAKRKASPERSENLVLRVPSLELMAGLFVVPASAGSPGRLKAGNERRAAVTMRFANSGSALLLFLHESD